MKYTKHRKSRKSRTFKRNTRNRNTRSKRYKNRNKFGGVKDSEIRNQINRLLIGTKKNIEDINNKLAYQEYLLKEAIQWKDMWPDWKDRPELPNLYEDIDTTIKEFQKEKEFLEEELKNAEENRKLAGEIASQYYGNKEIESLDGKIITMADFQRQVDERGREFGKKVAEYTKRVNAKYGQNPL